MGTFSALPSTNMPADMLDRRTGTTPEGCPFLMYGKTATPTAKYVTVYGQTVGMIVCPGLGEFWSFFIMSDIPDHPHRGYNEPKEAAVAMVALARSYGLLD